MEVKEKKYRPLSTLPTHPILSSAVPGTASLVMEVVPQFQSLVQDIQSWMELRGDIHHEDTYFLPEESPVFIDPKVSAVVAHVLDFDYMPRPVVPGVQSAVSKAHSANAKVALSSILPSLGSDINVLVVGSGRGHDMTRCVRAHSANYHFTLVEPSAPRLCVSLDHAKKNDLHVVCSFPYTFNECITECKGPYDLILMNMSFQHIAGDSRLRGCLADMLSPKGVVLGTFFNHDSFFTNQAEVTAATGGAVAVSGLLDLDKTSENAVVGVRLVDVCGVSFFDNYVTPEVIDGFASFHGMTYTVSNGKSLAEDAPRALRDKYRTALSHPCSSLVTTVVMRPVTTPPPVPRPAPFSSFTGPVPKILPMKCLTPKEVPHFRGGTYYYAEKRDGIAQVLTFYPGGVRISDADGRMVGHIQVGFDLGHIYHVHAEKVGSRYWLLDCLPETFTDKNLPFCFRYRVLESLAKISVSFSLPFDLNQHHPVRSITDLFQLEVLYRERQRHNKPFEGVVLVPMVGRSWKGFSPTCRLKVERTIDRLSVMPHCECGNKEEHVVEFLVQPSGNETYLRCRLDKKVPNPPDVIAERRKAMSFEEGLLLLRGEADEAFSWDIHDLPASAFLHQTNEAVKREQWLHLYRSRASWPPSMHRKFLAGLACYMSQLVPIDESVDTELVAAEAADCGFFRPKLSSYDID